MLAELDDSDAKAFLPTPSDIQGNAWITCHLGPYPSQERVTLRMFESVRIGE